MNESTNEGGPVRGQIALLTAELLFVMALLIGVGLIYVPAALILGGLLGIVSCELHGAGAKP